MKEKIFIITFKVMHYITNMLSSCTCLLLIVVGILAMHNINIIIGLSSGLSLVTLLIGLYMGYMAGKIVDICLLLLKIVYLSRVGTKVCEPKVILSLYINYLKKYHHERG